MPFDKPQNLSVHVANFIAEKIITGVYPPESRIMEANIATELEVSRGPVREAMLILARKRLVKILPRRGAVVTSISTQQVEELYDVFVALIRVVVRNVAVLWQGDDLVGVELALEGMKQSLKNKDVPNYFEFTKQFLQSGLLLSGSELLSELVADLTPMVDRVHYLSLQRRANSLKQNFDLYSDLLTYTRRRDMAKIDQCLDQIQEIEKAAGVAAIEGAAASA